MEIASHTFLVTGSASGLGAACARRLAGLGGRVVAVDFDEASGSAQCAAIGDRARFVKADVTEPEEVQAAIEVAKAQFGRLDGVVHCAGVIGAARLVGKHGPHDLALFERIVRVNLVGTFNVARLSAAAMATNALADNGDGERGVIVTTASVAAFDGQIGQAAYAASKGGVAALTLPLARELAQFGIRVVAIAPGVFDTAMMAGISAEVRESLARQIPFPSRLGRPEEFAQLACQIIENPMLNGCVIRLDGALRMEAQ
jgi:NAD(P)-dependent dehydrogenase (short-subunit alcohol dehydrogenase family)